MLIDILRLICILGVGVCLAWAYEMPTWEKGKRPICLAIKFLLVVIYLYHC